MRDYHAEYLRRKPYKRNPEKARAYQRAYYLANKRKVDAASAVRLKEWRERKARQRDAVKRWLDLSDRFNHEKLCNEINKFSVS